MDEDQIKYCAFNQEGLLWTVVKAARPSALAPSEYTTPLLHGCCTIQLPRSSESSASWCQMVKFPSDILVPLMSWPIVTKPPAGKKRSAFYTIKKTPTMCTLITRNPFKIAISIRRSVDDGGVFTTVIFARHHNSCVQIGSVTAREHFLPGARLILLRAHGHCGRDRGSSDDCFGEHC
jgi:hypothetical protein